MTPQSFLKVEGLDNEPRAELASATVWLTSHRSGMTVRTPVTVTGHQNGTFEVTVASRVVYVGATS